MNEERQRMYLYRVTCRGMGHCLGSTMTHGIGYVVASNPDEAYKKMRFELDTKNLGLSSERALEKIELIAEEGRFAECGTRLYL